MGRPDTKNELWPPNSPMRNLMILVNQPKPHRSVAVNVPHTKLLDETVRRI